MHFSGVFVLLCWLKTLPIFLSQKKLDDTEEVLKDFQEKHSQANCTIKEKEFIISNLLQSGRFSAVTSLKYPETVKVV